jgi:membrane protease YdiL (CAAX protease family)
MELAGIMYGSFHWFDHLYAFFLIVVMPAMSMRSAGISADMADMLPPKKHLFYTNGLMLIISGLLVLTSWNVSDRPWYTLGIAMPQITQLAVGIISAIGAIYITDIIWSMLQKKWSKDPIDDLAYVLPVNWTEYRHYIFLAFAAGISEELVFRGFLMHYLGTYFEPLPYAAFLTVLVPAAVFAISHLYQGVFAVLKISILACLFGWLYLETTSIIPVMIIHVAIDLISGMLGVLERRGRRRN